MIHYIAPDGSLHAISASMFECLLPVGSVRATVEQVQAIQNPQKSSKDAELATIAELEASITQRRMREAVLGIDDGWLAGVNTAIAVLRAQL